MLEKISNDFARAQGIAWLLELHKWIEVDRKNYGRRSQAKTRPIFLNQLNEPVAACNDDGESCLFRPGPRGCVESRKGNTVLPEFVAAPASKALLDEYGVRESTPVDDVRSLLKEEWDFAKTKEEHLVVFQMVFDAYRSESDVGRRQIREMLMDRCFLGDGAAGGEWKACRNLYFRSPELEAVLREVDGSFIDFDAYLAVVGKDAVEMLREFLRNLGVADRLRLKERNVSINEFTPDYMKTRSAWSEPSAAYRHLQIWTELEVDGLNKLLDKTNHSQKTEDKSRLSVLVWKLLVEEVAFLAGKGEDAETIEGGLFPRGTHKYSHYKDKEETFDNLLLFKMRTIPWLLTKDGSLKVPSAITARDLHGDLKVDTHGGKILQTILGMKIDPLEDLLEKYVIDSERSDEIRRLFAEEAVKNQANDFKNDAKNIMQKKAYRDETYLPIDEAVKKKLAEIAQTAAPREVVDVLGDRSAAIVTIPQLFSMNLCIPNYQRPYKWDKDNVWDFMDDIKRMVVEKKTAENDWCDLPYRMGSIILHKEQTGDGGSVYNIVDGQQRILTFALLALALGTDIGVLRRKDFYPALVQMPESRRNLNNNLCHIIEYMTLHNNIRAAFAEALNKSLQVVVVSVDERDYAFQLFDSQNVKGRRLEPHDLLKAYHLRELDEAIRNHPERYGQLDHAAEDPRVNIVTTWENFKIQDLSYLFDKLLYPILKWSGREKCYGFTTKDLKTFKGVPQHYEGKYGYVDRAFAVSGRDNFCIGPEFAPGKEFFDMVSHYQNLLIEVRGKIDGCRDVKAILENGCSNAYVKALFEAVLLAYFDRFGLDLPQEDMESAIRILCKWVYSVRLDMEYFSPKTPNKYALGVADGSSKYTNRIAMFAAIKNAVFHTDVAKMTVRMSQTTKDSQKTEERKALWELVNAL